MARLRGVPLARGPVKPRSRGAAGRMSQSAVAGGSAAAAARGMGYATGPGPSPSPAGGHRSASFADPELPPRFVRDDDSGARALEAAGSNRVDDIGARVDESSGARADSCDPSAARLISGGCGERAGPRAHVRVGGVGGKLCGKGQWEVQLRATVQRAVSISCLSVCQSSLAAECGVGVTAWL